MDSSQSNSNRLDAVSRALGRFINTPGPIFIALVALALGAASLVLTPREEEPQIVVPLADVMVRAPGLSARQVERQIATPLENLLYQIEGVEYVYSMSRAGSAIVTVRFYVGEDREESLVKIYNQMFSNTDKVPEAVESWVVKPIEVDDVPIVIAMLWSEDPEQTDDHGLRRLAEEVVLKLQGIQNTNEVGVTGGRPREIRIELKPEALAARRTAPLDILRALNLSNDEMPAGDVKNLNRELVVQAGLFFRDADALADSVVNVVDGRPVYMKDVADVIDGPAEADDYTWIGFGPASAGDDPKKGVFPAVSVSVAKRKGSNAVWVADNVLNRLERMEAELFPPHVNYRIIRNYGETADEKVNDLASSLLVAILTVVVFIGVVMGWRSALVVGLAVPICYGLTLGVNLFTDYTINRVTLFALILAIGLLVDDPITGVDNIDRYLQMGRFRRIKSILLAMQEVRMALIMSTIAIILSFVPLFFITGMMGPYMAPMAFNVPLAVIASTVVAFLVTPWLSRKILRPKAREAGWDIRQTGLYRFYNMLLRPMVTSNRKAAFFLGLVGAAFLLANILPAFRLVPLKLLPFDNKDEFQIVVDMPEGRTLEEAEGVTRAVAEYLRTVPEVKEFAAFAGTNSPIDFNGMVRQYYLREGSNVADIRVTLAPKGQRAHQSHEIVLRIRNDIDEIAANHGAIIKLVETPPGPPVISSIVVELYGEQATPYERLQKAAQDVVARLEREPHVVDIDTSVEADQTKLIFETDKEKAALSGIATEDVAQTIALAVEGVTAEHLEIPSEANPLPIRVQLPMGRRNSPTDVETVTVKGRPGIAKVREGGGVSDAPQPLVPLGEIGEFSETLQDKTIYHKQLRPVVYVYAETAGRAPADVIQDVAWDRGKGPGKTSYRPVEDRTYLTFGAGDSWMLPDDVTPVWSGEGEWKITIRVFRDLGLAFAAAMVGIFIVLTIQTSSVAISLIIMLAIPLTAIGIMPGFWVLNSIGELSIDGHPNPTFFTATAMIGMIALSGIVVRNSLILVEFIHQSLKEGMAFDEALVQAGAIRMRPVVLTAGTTMLGNLVITLDPIFSGLAWAIIFGIFASTLFTLGVIPIVYYLVYKNVEGHGVPSERVLEE